MKKVGLALGISLLIVAAAPAVNFAQTTPTSSTPATNISNEYSYFLKNVNSQQVVNDLRNGQWTTTTIDPQTNTTTTTTQPLPTGKMGYGNVKISLALAQESLSQQGITQPTSQQLYTALAGGQMTPGGPTTTGILQLRAQGMGWGQIAQKYNIKLGQLMSGKQPASTTTTTTTSTTTTAKGITTAGGNSSTTSTGKGNGNAFSGNKSQDSGIVSASGRSAGTYSSSNGNGIVSGSGRSIGQPSGIVTGAGNGNQYGASGASHGNGGGNGMGHGR
jgi:hypothetical protein